MDWLENSAAIAALDSMNEFHRLPLHSPSSLSPSQKPQLNPPWFNNAPVNLNDIPPLPFSKRRIRHNSWSGNGVESALHQSMIELEAENNCLKKDLQIMIDTSVQLTQTHREDLQYTHRQYMYELQMQQQHYEQLLQAIEYKHSHALKRQQERFDQLNEDYHRLEQLHSHYVNEHRPRVVTFDEVPVVEPVFEPAPVTPTKTKKSIKLQFRKVMASRHSSKPILAEPRSPSSPNKNTPVSRSSRTLVHSNTSTNTPKASPEQHISALAIDRGSR